jgi:NAD-dependent aldehyde dehydrogenases
MIKELRMGDVRDFRNFMGAVIDKKGFDKISGYIADAHANANIVAGGKTDDSKGYFVEPTLVETADPCYRLMQEEIFGPVITAYAYDDGKWEETLELVDRTSPYALTGGVFARSARARRGELGAAQRGWQLLHQRQAHRRGRRTAAVRRLARIGDE